MLLISPVESAGLEPANLLLARQALSQLSYDPKVGMTGFEPTTSRSRTERSAKLNYIPILRKRESNPLSSAYETDGGHSVPPFRRAEYRT